MFAKKFTNRLNMTVQSRFYDGLTKKKIVTIYDILDFGIYNVNNKTFKKKPLSNFVAVA